MTTFGFNASVLSIQVVKDLSESIQPISINPSSVASVSILLNGLELLIVPAHPLYEAQEATDNPK